MGTGERRRAATGRWRLAAVALVVAVLAAGCAIESGAGADVAGEGRRPPTTRITRGSSIIDAMTVTRDRGRVGIVGDSITDLSRPWVALTLGGGWDVTVTAKAGNKIDDQMPFARALAAADLDAILIEIGTNDAVKGNDDVEGDLRRMAAVVEDVPCVVWYTVSVYATDIGKRASRINEEIRAVAADRPNFHVTDWGSASTRRPGTLNPIDGIHPTAAGKELLTAMYKWDLVDQCGLLPVPADAPPPSVP